MANQLNKEQQAWVALRIYCTYRLVLSVLLLILFFSGWDKKLLLIATSNFYYGLELSYFVIAIILFLLARFYKKHFSTQLHTQLIIDISLLSLLLYSSSQSEMMFGVLIAAVIANASLLVTRSVLFIFAAYATLLQLLKASLFFASAGTVAMFPMAGWWGITYFATTIFAYGLLAKVKASEATAHEKTAELMTLEKINQYVIHALNAELQAKAQALKLAALGRLTASIAHEIRNPLAAISYANQLLVMQLTDDPKAEKLLTIIQQQSERINKIIISMLALAKPTQHTPQTIDLIDWLPTFLAKNYFDNADTIKTQFNDNQLAIFFDEQHLEQILINLCDNGLRAGREHNKIAELSIIVSKINDNKVAIDIIDNGPGIPADLTTKIFEPFFTTAEDGNGLGLYICNQFAILNQALLTVMPHESGAKIRLISRE